MKRLTPEETEAALREAFPHWFKFMEDANWFEDYGGGWTIHTPREVGRLLRIPGAVRLCMVNSAETAYGGDSGWRNKFPTTRAAVFRLMRDIDREERQDDPDSPRVQVHAYYHYKTRTLEIGA